MINEISNLILDSTIEVVEKIKKDNPSTNAYMNCLKKEPIRYSDDVNDYPTPKLFCDKLINRIIDKKIFGDVLSDDFTDLCCNDINKKFSKGLTLNGSIGITPELNGDSLKQNWFEISKCGFIASPYKIKGESTRDGGIQARFAEKAVEEAKNGMKIVALFQDSTDTHWYHKYIYNNPNCVHVTLESRLKYPGTKGTPNYGNIIVFFGIKKLSKINFEYFRTLTLQYNKEIADEKEILKEKKKEEKNKIKELKRHEKNILREEKNKIKEQKKLQKNNLCKTYPPQQNIDENIMMMREILENGNKLFCVTKPNLFYIKRICSEFYNYQHKLYICLLPIDTNFNIVFQEKSIRLIYYLGFKTSILSEYQFMKDTVWFDFDKQNILV